MGIGTGRQADIRHPARNEDRQALAQDEVCTSKEKLADLDG